MGGESGNTWDPLGPWDSLIIDLLTRNLDINLVEQNVRSSVPNGEITHLILVVLGIEPFKNVNVMFAFSFMLEHSPLAPIAYK